MTVQDAPDKVIALQGALRSRVVARLVGFAPRRLRWWHEMAIVEAHEEPGARGYPRLYSWVDYMKLRAAVKLHRQGVPTRRLRSIISRLDSDFPDWYLISLRVWGQRVLRAVHDGLVEVPSDQMVLPFLEPMLEEIKAEGPLGALSQFGDVIDMDPSVIAGNPVVRGTRLETRFIAELASRGVPRDGIARRYGLTTAQIERIIEFDSLVA